MLTVPQAARRAGRNPETIRRWIREGKLPATKVGTQHVIDEDDFEAVLQGAGGSRHANDQIAGPGPSRDGVAAPRDARSRRHVSEIAAPYGTDAAARSPQAVGDPWLPAIVGRIVRLVDPVRIILFGSRARGDARPDSDYDLLVIVDELPQRRESRLSIRRSLADLEIALDILVAEPSEVAPGRRGPRGIIQWAAEQGRVVYERS